MNEAEYISALNAAFKSYQYENTSSQRFRQDGFVPYSNHAIWAATTILLDVKLPRDVREEAYFTLLFHDVKEDTSGSIPEWLLSRIESNVTQMTFKNFMSSIPRIPYTSPFIKLCLLVDKLSTLIEEHIPTEPPEKRKLWKDMVIYLAQETEKHYGRCQVVIMAEAFIAASVW